MKNKGSFHSPVLTYYAKDSCISCSQDSLVVNGEKININY